MDGGRREGGCSQTCVSPDSRRVSILFHHGSICRCMLWRWCGDGERGGGREGGCGEGGEDPRLANALRADGGMQPTRGTE